MNRSRPPATVAELLAEARTRLADPREATILIADALGLSRETLYAHPERKVSTAAAERALTLVARRAAGEPVAYLIGTREFYGLRLMVTPDVLIPRPETELPVELALRRMAGLATPVVADLGTGSGAIALALAHARPDAYVIATDCSESALAVASANAQRLGSETPSPLRGEGWGEGDRSTAPLRGATPHPDLLPQGEKEPETAFGLRRPSSEGEKFQQSSNKTLNNVRFVRTDLLAAFAAYSFDVIVSNPPYVAADDPHLGEGDLRFEPMMALSAGPDGLDVIRRIIKEAAARLKPGGSLILEHGATQQPAVCRLLRQHGYTSIETRRDLAGLPRAVAACNAPAGYAKIIESANSRIPR